MRVLKPKFVKNARMWCVTLYVENKNVVKQTIKWFGSEEEAQAFYENPVL